MGRRASMRRNMLAMDEISSSAIADNAAHCRDQ
jgi:hypothetical protein